MFQTDVHIGIGIGALHGIVHNPEGLQVFLNEGVDVLRTHVVIQLAVVDLVAQNPVVYLAIGSVLSIVTLSQEVGSSSKHVQTLLGGGVDGIEGSALPESNTGVQQIRMLGAVVVEQGHGDCHAVAAHVADQIVILSNQRGEVVGFAVVSVAVVGRGVADQVRKDQVVVTVAEVQLFLVCGHSGADMQTLFGRNLGSGQGRGSDLLRVGDEIAAGNGCKYTAGTDTHIKLAVEQGCGSTVTQRYPETVIAAAGVSGCRYRCLVSDAVHIGGHGEQVELTVIGSNAAGCLQLHHNAAGIGRVDDTSQNTGAAGIYGNGREHTQQHHSAQQNAQKSLLRKHNGKPPTK